MKMSVAVIASDRLRSLGMNPLAAHPRWEELVQPHRRAAGIRPLRDPRLVQFALNSKFVLQEADVGLEREVLMPVLRQAIRPPLGFRAVHAAGLAEWCSG